MLPGMNGLLVNVKISTDKTRILAFGGKTTIRERYKVRTK
jgi:hypothetical protein